MSKPLVTSSLQRSHGGRKSHLCPEIITGTRCQGRNHEVERGRGERGCESDSVMLLQDDRADSR